MLKDLEILNGELSLEFNSLNTIYTIDVSSDTTKLELEYIASPGTEISIIGNNLTNPLNEVVITVFNDEESMSYYLYVYKEESSEVSPDLSSGTALNIATNSKIFNYAVPVISSVCFLTILLLFTFLFHKRG